MATKKKVTKKKASKRARLTLKDIEEIPVEKLGPEELSRACWQTLCPRDRKYDDWDRKKHHAYAPWESAIDAVHLQTAWRLAVLWKDNSVIVGPERNLQKVSAEMKHGGQFNKRSAALKHAICRASVLCFRDGSIERVD